MYRDLPMNGLSDSRAHTKRLGVLMCSCMAALLSDSVATYIYKHYRAPNYVFRVCAYATGSSTLYVTIYFHSFRAGNKLRIFLLVL